MSNESKQCADCLKTLSLSDFYQIRGSDEGRIRWEKICKSCKRQRRKMIPQMGQGDVPLVNEVAASTPEVPATTEGQARLRDDGQVIYKEYLYPNGEILQLTKEEFDRVVDVFRMLQKQDQKLNKPPAA